MQTIQQKNQKMDRNQFAEERFLMPPNQEYYTVMQYCWERLVVETPIEPALKFIWPWWTPPSMNNYVPTREEILAIRGNFLALGDFQHPVFMMPGMNTDERRNLIYLPQRQSGFRTLPFGWKTYYPSFPNWQFDYSERLPEFQSLLQEVNRERFIRLLFIPIEEADSLDQHIERIKPKLEYWHNNYDSLSWGWEINDINDWTRDGDIQLKYIENLIQITKGEKPIYSHWTPERWSGWPNYRNGNDHRSELDWLNRAKAIGLRGVLYQEPYDKPVKDVLDRALYYDKKNYIGPGICGRVMTAGLDFIMFEHSRENSRWNEIGKAVITDGRSKGIC